MNTESLKTFLMLARCASFTKTAQELFVVQSTVSSRIQGLEAEVGKKLFIRGKNGVTLTAAGKSLVNYAMQVVEMEKSIITEINNSSAYVDHLTVGCPHSLFDCYVSSSTISFLENNPNTSVKIHIAHSNELIAELSSYTLDVAYAFLPFNHPRYICKPFIKERLIVTTNSNNREYADGITKEELLDVPMIISDVTTTTSFEWLLTLQRVYPLDINIMSKIVPFLKSGNWYCFLPLGLVEEDIKRGELIEIPLLNMPPLEKQSYIIFKKAFKQAPAIPKWLDAQAV